LLLKLQMDNYLKKQIITYMGNKRKLLGQIDQIIHMIKLDLGDNIITADAFSGSGIVSRLLKTVSSKLYVNDIAGYSKTLNMCYLDTPSTAKKKKINELIDSVNKVAHNFKLDIGESRWISRYWAPSGEIVKKDRVYYTKENGILIDRYRHLINQIPETYRPYLLAQLIVKSSIHNNTNGQFSAFYKDERGIGKYGGKKEIDIKRITSSIKLEYPIFSPNPCEIDIRQQDSNQWVREIPPVDLIYLDPPYNKHPYSIYYFMLDIINNWDTTAKIPNTNRGQPKNWIKSEYNSINKAKKTFEDLIKNIKAKFILLSYNNKGIIPISDIEKILKTKGKLFTFPLNHKTYNKLKGIASYKRKEEWSDVKEFMWLVDTRKN
jgi:adenine-specific DNA-methyltransferase